MGSRNEAPRRGEVVGALRRRCEVSAPGTAGYTVCWVSSLVCKGNNVVFPPHHPRANMQEIHWQVPSELRLPRHV